MTDHSLRHVANGVYRSGRPALPPELAVDDLSAVTRGRPDLAPHLAALRRWLEARGGEALLPNPTPPNLRAPIDEYVERQRRAGRKTWGPPHGVDARNLGQTGWGLILPATLDDARRAELRRRLAPLLERRQQEAGPLYRELELDPGESKSMFLARHGVGDGPAVPSRVPYYLLLLGDPSQISLSFQFELGVQYAVGRLCLADDAAYEAYARAAAQAPWATASRVRFFGTDNRDEATTLARRHLVDPLHGKLAISHVAKGWSVEKICGEHASRRALEQVLGERLDLLFTASHGLLEDFGSPDQPRRQGALVCSDWRGTGQVEDAMIFGGDDLDEDLDLRGLVSFHFACFSAGTPQLDGFTQALLSGRRADLRPSPLAPRDFLAWLPTRMLGNPGGASLAAIGHVDRAWSSSFVWDSPEQATPQPMTSTSAFENTLGALLDGVPVGAALDHMRVWYGEKAAALVEQLGKIRGRNPTPAEAGTLAYAWTCAQDARSYLLLGDPAVQLRTPHVAVTDRSPSVVVTSSTQPSTPAATKARTEADARAVVKRIVDRLERWTTDDPGALPVDERRELLDELAALGSELRSMLLPPEHHDDE